MAAPLTGALVLSGASQGTITTSSEATSTNDPLAGIYELWTTKPCWLRVGPYSTEVTTADGYNLSTSVRPHVMFVDQFLSAVTTGSGEGSTSATLFYHRVG